MNSLLIELKQLRRSSAGLGEDQEKSGKVVNRLYYWLVEKYDLCKYKSTAQPVSAGVANAVSDSNPAGPLGVWGVIDSGARNSNPTAAQCPEPRPVPLTTLLGDVLSPSICSSPPKPQ